MFLLQPVHSAASRPFDGEGNSHATADAAMSRAEEPNNCCAATTEKIDRAFKKSQSK